MKIVYAAVALSLLGSALAPAVLPSNALARTTYYVVITQGSGYEIWSGGDIFATGAAYSRYLVWQDSHPFLTIWDYPGFGGPLP